MNARLGELNASSGIVSGWKSAPVINGKGQGQIPRHLANP